MELKVIAYAHNGHTDKFGIPRQSRSDSPIETRIVFEPEYSVREAVRGMEGFSHLWLLWGFSQNTRDRSSEAKDIKSDRVSEAKDAHAEIGSLDKEDRSWTPTVRPPRLGGNTRVGVFATRSPFRPNAIGMSSVALQQVLFAEEGPEKGRIVLVVRGADVMDGTPIYDIKPYLSFSDSHPEAQNGFAQKSSFDRWIVQLEVSIKSAQSLDILSTTSYIFSDDGTSDEKGSITPRLSVEKHSMEMPDEKTMQDIVYILSQNPCPAYQQDPEREYKMEYGGWRVTFCVQCYEQPDEQGMKGVVRIKNIQICE